MSARSKPIKPSGHVVRDPVHGLIRIEKEDAFLLDLIDTPEFQRLRRIRQLGVGSMTYSGAEHSRFVHSHGVLNFAQRILAALRHRYRDQAVAEKLFYGNSRVAMAAALLHDIGHGPFSHMMERMSERVVDHEKKTVEIIKLPESRVSQVLKVHGIDPVEVCAVIEHASDYPLLSDLVSSQLDADRMDYILRDALSTGVKYGAFDADWLINSLCIGSEPTKGDSDDPRNWRLCLEERRGLHSAEQLIVARMHMSLQVYFHRTTRCWEAHLLCLFNLAMELVKAGKLPEKTPAIVAEFFESRGNLSHEKFLHFDESMLTAALHIWATDPKPAEPRLVELSQGYLFRKAAFICRELTPLNFTRATRLQKTLAGHGKEGVDWLLDEIIFNSYKDFGSIFQKARKLGEEEISTTAILLADGELGHESKPVESSSFLFEAMGGNPAKAITRLYYHHGMAEHVDKILKDY